MIAHEELVLDELLDAVRPLLPPDLEVSSSGASFVEVTAPGVDKGAALARLADRLGLGAEHVVAFGDQHNDLAMLAWAGRGYAMANAHPVGDGRHHPAGPPPRRTRRRPGARPPRSLTVPSARPGPQGDRTHVADQPTDAGGMAAAHDQRRVKELLLSTVVPPGWVNVMGLIAAPLAMAVVIDGQAALGPLHRWIVAIWAGAVVQGLLLVTRTWWWARSARAWERAYAVLMVVIGTTWGTAITIPVVAGDAMTFRMIVVAFLVMTTAAGVVAFSGSRLIGSAFIGAQWLTFLALVMHRSLDSLIMVAVLVGVCAVAYLEFTSRMLVRSVNAQVRANELSEALRIQAATDSLTGLPNRPAILATMDERLGAGDRPTVLFVDLDGFKDINDVHGHGQGDLVIVETARRLQDTMRASDVAGRLGGDEFVVILGGAIDDENAHRLAERLTERLAGPIGDHSLRVTASVGVASAGRGETADALLRRADLAMYAVKGRGGNAVMTFDSDHEHSSTHLLRLKSELRTDVERGALVALARPIVGLADRSVVGLAFEPSWTRSNGDVVPSEVFVPLAEQLGLERAVGRIVLDHAAAAAHRLGLVCTVDVGFRHLVGGQLFVDLVDASTRHEAPPELLSVEIADSHATAGSERAIAEIVRLQGIGVSVAIDHWGLVGSSIACLECVPLNRLKLAPELAGRVMASDRSMRVIRRIAALADELGIEIVAQGIDDERTATMIHSIGIGLGQGDHVGPAFADGELPGLTEPG